MTYCLDKLRMGSKTNDKLNCNSAKIRMERFSNKNQKCRCCVRISAWEKGLGNRLVYHNHHSNPR